MQVRQNDIAISFPVVEKCGRRSSFFEEEIKKRESLILQPRQ